MSLNDNLTKHAESTCGAQIKDTNRGNPKGDVVDNSAGRNPSRDTSKVYNVGTNLAGMAMAPSILGIKRTN